MIGGTMSRYYSHNEYPRDHYNKALPDVTRNVNVPVELVTYPFVAKDAPIEEVRDTIAPTATPFVRLSTDSAERKDAPVFSGVLAYFPLALAEVAKLSKIGNDKHNPGQPLHWSRDKSADHKDCIVRHLLEAGTIDTDGLYHDVKVAWRALANLQVLLEEKR